LRAALRTYRNGDWEQAVTELSQALSTTNAAKVLEPLGLSHYRLENHAQAAQLFEQLIALSTKNGLTASAHHNFAIFVLANTFKPKNTIVAPSS